MKIVPLPLWSMVPVLFLVACSHAGKWFDVNGWFSESEGSAKATPYCISRCGVEGITPLAGAVYVDGIGVIGLEDYRSNIEFSKDDERFVKVVEAALKTPDSEFENDNLLWLFKKTLQVKQGCNLVPVASIYDATVTPEQQTCYRENMDVFRVEKGYLPLKVEE